MDRRSLIVSGLATALGGPALAQDVNGAYHGDNALPDNPPGARSAPASGDDEDREAPPPDRRDNYTGPNGPPPRPYERSELVSGVSDFLGVTAESAGGAIQHAFRDNGQPTAYIAGTEGSGAFILGLRYGKGLLYMKDRPRMTVFWQGPTGGFDVGGNASRVFTLCYDLMYPDAIFRRFPGVEGTAYFVGGLGVNYQRADGITLAPIRAGVGLRLGANIGYLSYSRERHPWPF
jgi:hypothetical protein